MKDSRLTIRPVESDRDVERFIEAAHVAQGPDPHWVPPLRAVLRRQLDPKKNPWFRHGEAALWVAELGGRPVGRISAQVDRRYVERYEDASGFFGFFESIDEQRVADALFDRAAAWLGERGMRRCIGPFSFNINQESGLLVQGWHCPPRMMMGHAQPYYRRLVEESGFDKLTDMLAYLTPMDTALPFKQIQWLERVLARNSRLAVRPLDMRRFEEEIGTIGRLFNDAWAGKWGFIPLDEAELAHLAREMRALIVPELVAIATFDGRPVAMCVALPDFNEMIADLDGRLWPLGWWKLAWRIAARRSCVSRTRVPFMGVAPAYKNKAMGSVLALLTVGAVRKASLELGMPVSEMSWVLENNRQARHCIEDIGGRVYKTYRIYAKATAGERCGVRSL